MSDIEFRATAEVRAAMLRLKGADKTIRREMYAAVNRATKPIRSDMKASIPPSLPNRGGLASLVTQEFTSRTSPKGGRNASVTIFTKARNRDLRRMNQGRLRHPVFGNRGVWVDQSAGVIPGFLDEAFENSKGEAQREVLRGMSDVARKVE